MSGQNFIDIVQSLALLGLALGQYTTAKNLHWLSKIVWRRPLKDPLKDDNRPTN
jgi:hypothetical protein